MEKRIRVLYSSWLHLCLWCFCFSFSRLSSKSTSLLLAIKQVRQSLLESQSQCYFGTLWASRKLKTSRSVMRLSLTFSYLRSFSKLVSRCANAPFSKIWAIQPCSVWALLLSASQFTVCWPGSSYLKWTCKCQIITRANSTSTHLTTPKTPLQSRCQSCKCS